MALPEAGPHGPAAIFFGVFLCSSRESFSSHVFDAGWGFLDPSPQGAPPLVEVLHLSMPLIPTLVMFIPFEPGLHISFISASSRCLLDVITGDVLF